MTVCVAAICTWVPGEHMIVGATDRMITAADVQFEPDQSKVFRVSKNVVIMLAGDPAPLMAVCDATAACVRDAWDTVSVRQIVDVFTNELTDFRGRLGELLHLRPLGLTREWCATNAGSDIANNVRDFDLGPGNPTALIAGCDETGAHIWIVNKWGIPRCLDLEGFAAIGSGEWHANSHFMVSKYSKLWIFQRAALVTYYAKRKAEVGPGISKSTDVFFIGRDGFTPVREDLVLFMERAIDRMEREIKPLADEAELNVTEFMNRIISEVPPPPPTLAPGDWSGTDTASTSRPSSLEDDKAQSASPPAEPSQNPAGAA